jgi:hypothetical protein
MRPFARLLATVALLTCAPVHAEPGPPPAPGKVALTFDDLPGLTLFTDQRWVDYLNAECCAG